MFSGTYPGSMSKWAALQPERVNSDVSNTRGCAAIDTDMLVRQYILGGTQITADGSFCCLSATYPASDMHFLFETGPHYAAKGEPRIPRLKQPPCVWCSLQVHISVLSSPFNYIFFLSKVTTTSRIFSHFTAPNRSLNVSPIQTPGTRDNS